jgi:hypothetical protein
VSEYTAADAWDDLYLAAQKRWWLESDPANPFYVWRTIGYCLASKRRLPGWCLDYLAESARKLGALGGEETPEQVAAAIGWRSKGHKSPRKRLLDDDRDMRAALDLARGQTLQEVATACYGRHVGDLRPVEAHLKNGARLLDYPWAELRKMI